MSSMNFASLLPEVNIQIPNVPDPLAVSRLAKAARDFCRKSLVWEICIPISLLAGRECYELRCPRETEIASVIRVSVDGRQIAKATPAELACKAINWETRTGDRVVHYYRDAYDRLRVYPIPETAAAHALTVTLALMPTKDATAMDAQVLRRFEDYIVAGAQAQLYAMPNKAWTALDLALALSSTFMIGISEARVAHRAGDVVGSRRVQQRPLA